MTISSGFFATSPETNYTEPQFIEYFQARQLNGIHKDSGYTNTAFNTGDELIVSAQAVPDLSVKVGTGRADVNAYWLKNDTEYTVSISANTSGLTRIDRIVLHLDTSTKAVTIIAKEGTPSASPTAPALTRTSNTYELSLAQVEIPSGDSAIQENQITDERSDVTLCGYASEIIYHNEDMDMSDNKIINLAAPTVDSDASTKKYVDDALTTSGLLSNITPDTNKDWLGYDITNLGVIGPNEINYNLVKLISSTNTYKTLTSWGPSAFHNYDNSFNLTTIYSGSSINIDHSFTVGASATVTFTLTVYINDVEVYNNSIVSTSSGNLNSGVLSINKNDTIRIVTTSNTNNTTSGSLVVKADPSAPYTLPDPFI